MVAIPDTGASCILQEARVASYNQMFLAAMQKDLYCAKEVQALFAQVAEAEQVRWCC